MNRFNAAAAYQAPALREVKTSIESGFAISVGIGVEDYGDGNEDWLQ